MTFEGSVTKVVVTIWKYLKLFTLRYIVLGEISGK